jgi:hypothetical protein
VVSGSSLSSGNDASGRPADFNPYTYGRATGIPANAKPLPGPNAGYTPRKGPSPDPIATQAATSETSAYIPDETNSPPVEPYIPDETNSPSAQISDQTSYAGVAMDVGSYIRDHGVISLGGQAGNGFGIQGQITLSRTGIGFYSGMGAVAGVSLGLTVGGQWGNASGFTVQGAESFGLGFGESLSLSVSPGVGAALEATAGFEYGAAAGATAGYAGTLWEF